MGISVEHTAGGNNHNPGPLKREYTVLRLFCAYLELGVPSEKLASNPIKSLTCNSHSVELLLAGKKSAEKLGAENDEDSDGGRVSCFPVDPSNLADGTAIMMADGDEPAKKVKEFLEALREKQVITEYTKTGSRTFTINLDDISQVTDLFGLGRR